ncbi:pre-rRNA 2' [Octopus vulgaris]|uniref:Putative rRNA methyltransferase n=1 Tax=Octopus vulgaris TaxID=6645 RepID=A0AA36F529_OCTVU|nr:pre-rRNA 2' [Octopus vulgaris]
MGKKAKVGKARKDRFYQLAKETGYRARSAFKLIQLNRKFEFLQKSRVVVDLCAAPGGWLQVCVENTPVSALVVGVDLVPIRPIPRTTCLQNDITTESCRVAIKKELQDWKADSVLNDGAPNVGKSWVHDAFQQAQLTLSALRLAAGILRKGGWFVTKVFRSKDYNSLIWVFNQLFKKVHATKPQASRTESAEIFVVCESYLAPDKLDPKFFDPKHVFKEVEDTKMLLNTFKPEQKQRNREGYADGLTNLYFPKNVSEFINNQDYLKILASCTELLFDDQSILEDPLTTEEIKICCKDIRVLGKKDIKRLIGWRKHILKQREADAPQAPVEEEKVDSDEDEEIKLQELLATAKEEERKTIKKRLKKIREQKLKLTQRMDMKMAFPDDEIEQIDDIGLFQLQKIKSEKGLEKIQKGDLSLADEEALIDDDDIFIPKIVTKVSYNRDPTEREDYDYNIDSDDGEEPKADDDDDDISMAELSDDDELEELDGKKKVDDGDDGIEEKEKENPLLVSLTEKQTTSEKVAEWFSKDSFSALISKDEKESEASEDEMKDGKDEIDDLKIPSKAKAKNKKEDFEVIPVDNSIGQQQVFSSDDEDDDDNDDDDDDDDDSEEEEDNLTAHKAKKRVAPELDPEGLALAAKMVHSKKQRREVIESGYHKFMYDDPNLPRWFLKEEEKHARKNVPVTKAEMEEYKKQMKEVDARPIKKVAEAKIRKKLRMTKKLQKVRKRAETITDCVDTSEREKWLKIKEIYKKAGLLTKQKKEVSYVISKKGGGTKGAKPKGPFKVVDRRLKKDKRSMKAKNNQKKKGGKGKKKVK